MVEKGMSPMQAIVGATRTVAKGYRKDAFLGSIAPAKFADIVLLDKDPLADIGNLAAVASVYQAGRLVDREALPSRPLVTSPAVGDPA